MASTSASTPAVSGSRPRRRDRPRRGPGRIRGPVPASQPPPQVQLATSGKISVPMRKEMTATARMRARSSAPPSAAVTRQREQHGLPEKKRGHGRCGTRRPGEEKSGAAHQAPVMAARQQAELVVQPAGRRGVGAEEGARRGHRPSRRSAWRSRRPRSRASAKIAPASSRVQVWPQCRARVSPQYQATKPATAPNASRSPTDHPAGGIGRGGAAGGAAEEAAEPGSATASRCHVATTGAAFVMAPSRRRHLSWAVAPGMAHVGVDGKRGGIRGAAAARSGRPLSNARSHRAVEAAWRGGSAGKRVMVGTARNVKASRGRERHSWHFQTVTFRRLTPYRE